VWNQKSSAPKFRHRSLTAALAEADRLSLKYPDASFHVLEVVGKAEGGEWFGFGYPS
jgi:hypothetical protein